jgi:hypothetical protein
LLPPLDTIGNAQVAMAFLQVTWLEGRMGGDVPWLQSGSFEPGIYVNLLVNISNCSFFVEK